MGDQTISIHVYLLEHVRSPTVLTRVGDFYKLDIKHQECPGGNLVSDGEFPVSVLGWDDKLTEFPHTHIPQAQIPAGNYLSFAQSELKFAKRKRKF